jgi:hypothetical protein
MASRRFRGVVGVTVRDTVVVSAHMDIVGVEASVVAGVMAAADTVAASAVAMVRVRASVDRELKRSNPIPLDLQLCEFA